MGTDLHLYVEIRPRNSKEDWSPSSYQGVFNSRIYGMLAALNNAFDNSDMEHLESRGIPEDVSWFTFDEYYLIITDKSDINSGECTDKEAEKWVEDGESVILYGGGYKYCSRPDYHHPSWCTIKELEECYDKVLKKYKYETSEIIEWMSLINYMNTLEKIYDVRAVFWYDN
jgi:hypothetical protein